MYCCSCAEKSKTKPEQASAINSYTAKIRYTSAASIAFAILLCENYFSESDTTPRRLFLVLLLGLGHSGLRRHAQLHPSPGASTEVVRHHGWHATSLLRRLRSRLQAQMSSIGHLQQLLNSIAAVVHELDGHSLIHLFFCRRIRPIHILLSRT